MPRSLRIEFPGAYYHGQKNGVRVQNLTEIPAPLRSVHAKESPY